MHSQASLSAKLTKFYTRVDQNVHWNADAINQFLQQIAAQDKNTVASAKRVAILQKTMAKILSAESTDELALYQQSFNDIIDEVKINHDTLNIDNTIEALIQLTDLHKQAFLTDKNDNTMLRYLESAAHLEDMLEVFSAKLAELKNGLLEGLHEFEQQFLILNHSSAQYTKNSNETIYSNRWINQLRKLHHLKTQMHEVVQATRQALGSVNNEEHYAKSYENLHSGVDRVIALATDNSYLHRYKSKKVSNYLANQCKENVRNLCQTRACVLNSESGHVDQAISDLSKMGLVTVLTSLPISSSIYVAASHALSVADISYDSAVGRFARPQGDSTIFQRIQSTFNRVKAYAKNNPAKVLAGVCVAGLAIAMPFVFLPVVAATAYILSSACILSLLRSGYDLIARALSEKNRQGELDKRLASHLEDLENYSGKAVEPVVKTERNKQSFLKRVFDGMVAFSKKHPWSAPFLAAATAFGALVGWKVVAAAVVVSSVKGTVVAGSSLAALKTLGSTGVASGVSVLVNQAQHKQAENADNAARLKTATTSKINMFTSTAVKDQELPIQNDKVYQNQGNVTTLKIDKR